MAPARPTRHNVVRTLWQIVGMWGTFLLIVPLAIWRVEAALGFVPRRVRRRHAAGAALFGAMSALGLASGAAVALHGEGTPFPTDTARRLVLRGPYRHVRNPMALAGLGQGLGVALMRGSPLTALYVLAGGLGWNWLVRPHEERELLARFGAPYAHYRARVRCWWPNWQPYQTGEPPAESTA